MNKPIPPPIPGRRPLGGPRSKSVAPPRIGGQGSLAPVGPSPRGGSSLSRPPLVPVILSVALLAIEFWLVFKDRNQTGIHLMGALLGMFGSVALLGWFRQALNLRRSSNSFSDWAGPFESTKYVSVFVLASWVLGVVHLYVSVYELLRPGG